MKNLIERKYFSDRRSKTSSIRKAKSNPQDRAKSKSNEDLIEKEEQAERYQETRLAEEAMAQNLKLLKKQKARFLRLQKILSRNIVLIPLCVLFSVLSAGTIFAATLTNHYQYIYFDIAKLRSNVEYENNRTLSRVYQALFDNSSSLPFAHEASKVEAKRNIFTELKKPTEKRQKNEHFFNVGQMSHPTKLDRNVPDMDSASKSAQKNENPDGLDHKYANYFMYELISMHDAHILSRRNYFSSNNLTIKKYAIFPTNSGIWRLCNHLSGNFKFFF